MSTRVLVTGGAGFISSNFVRHLLHATPYEVVSLDALMYAGNVGFSQSLDLEHLGFRQSRYATWWFIPVNLTWCWPPMDVASGSLTTSPHCAR